MKTRPKNLNLFSIRLPVNALVSILHRVSGFVLFMVLPAILLGLQWSLESAQGFERVQGIFDYALVKLALLGLSWAFYHHILAGLRHLALDVHWGTELAKARLTSKAVLVGGILLTVITAVKLW